MYCNIIMQKGETPDGVFDVYIHELDRHIKALLVKYCLHDCYRDIKGKEHTQIFVCYRITCVPSDVAAEIMTKQYGICTCTVKGKTARFYVGNSSHDLIQVDGEMQEGDGE